MVEADADFLADGNLERNLAVLIGHILMDIGIGVAGQSVLCSDEYGLGLFGAGIGEDIFQELRYFIFPNHLLTPTLTFLNLAGEVPCAT